MIDIDAAPSEHLDQLEELTISPGWALLKQRIHSEIERARDLLERPSTSQDNTIKVRGLVEALRMVIELPDILKFELKQKEKA